jgi:hypothetical protein
MLLFGGKICSFFFLFGNSYNLLVFSWNWFSQSCESQSHTKGRYEMDIFQSTQKSNVDLMRGKRLFTQSLHLFQSTNHTASESY